VAFREIRENGARCRREDLEISVHPEPNQGLLQQQGLRFEMLRKDANEVICAKCGKTFSAEKERMFRRDFRRAAGLKSGRIQLHSFPAWTGDTDDGTHIVRVLR
jgi:hypothetical protein